MFERVMIEIVVISVFAGTMMSVPLKRGPAATAIIGVAKWQTRELQHRKHAKKLRTLWDMAPAVTIWLPRARNGGHCRIWRLTIWLPSATYMAFPRRKLGLKARSAYFFRPTATRTVSKM